MKLRNFKHHPLYRSIIRFVNLHFPVMMAKARHLKITGRRLDLQNPKDLNEKILWLSLFSDTSEWSRLADKYAVRDYVKECGLEEILIPLYGYWQNADEVDLLKLPLSFVLKSTNGSGTVMVVRDKNSLDLDSIKRTLNGWLKEKVQAETAEFHYLKITPALIAEGLLDISDDQNISTSPIDYKIWCFNGKAYYIWACMNRDEVSTEVAMFDTDWQYHPEMSVFNEHYRKQKELTKKPINLTRMIQIAEKLSASFPVVRVDLYNINGRIYFGELTFTSLGGIMDFFTYEALLKMGKMVDISKIKKVR